MFAFNEAILVLVNIYFLSSCNAAINNKYGPYHVTLDNMTRCNGSKPRVKSDIFIILKTQSNGSQELSANTTVHETIGPVGFRIKISLKDNNGKLTTIINYIIPNACKHFLMGPIVKLLPRLTEDCYLQKSQRTFVVGDADTLTHMWFGNNFFYGSYLSNLQMITPKEQILCLIADFTVSPKMNK